MPDSKTKPALSKTSETNRYKMLIESIFFDHWSAGVKAFEFARTELKTKADELKIALPDNIGDIIYSFRFRTALPPAIVVTQPIAVLETQENLLSGYQQAAPWWTERTRE